jgi:hypothetical protein
MRNAMRLHGLIMTDEIDYTRSTLVTYGVSDELAMLVQTVAEGMLLDGRPRCAPASIQEIRQRLLCHNYRKSLFELAHFIGGVAYLSGDLTSVLYLDEAVYPDGFKGVTQDWPANDELPFALEGNHLTLQFAEAPFDLHFSRVNVMAGWVDLLLLIVPGFLQDCESLANQCGRAEVLALAKRLQKQLADYLKDHLQTPTKLEEGMFWLHWTREHVGADNLTAAFNDDHVVLFWQHNWQEDDFDFKRYATVARAAHHFIQAVDIGEQQWQVGHAASLDQTNEDGDAWIENIVDVAEPYWEAMQVVGDLELEGALEGAQTDLTEEGDPLSLLQKPPYSEIKFLTAKQLKALEGFVAEYPRQLAVTALRVYIFGKQQARITGALQNKDPETFTRLLEGQELLNPDECASELQDIAASISTSRLATAHVLNLGGHPRGTLLMLLAAGMEVPEGTELGLLKKRAEQATEDWQTQCFKAFSANNRQGFKSLPDTDQLETYAIGDQQLAKLAERCEQRLAAFNQYGADTAEQIHFAHDAEMFTRQFQAIYGDRL